LSKGGLQQCLPATKVTGSVRHWQSFAPEQQLGRSQATELAAALAGSSSRALLQTTISHGISTALVTCGGCTVAQHQWSATTSELQCPSALLAQCRSMLHIHLMRIMLAACQRDVALQQSMYAHMYCRCQASSAQLCTGPLHTFDDHTGKLLLQTVCWLNLQLALFVCF
jgi:hypothetical protein